MRFVFLSLFFSLICPVYGQGDALSWRVKDFPSYQLYYVPEDSLYMPSLADYLRQGQSTVRDFFGDDFPKSFSVHIFPNRSSLDEQWARDWKQPGFKAECWMIASGVAARLDLLSPRTWSKQACDHNGKDTLEVKQVITHELVHIFHAQRNPSPGFDGMDDLSWLIEGLATYASGQLTEEKIKSVRKQLADGITPAALSDFWKGKLRYQQAGTLMKFIDERYGRNKLVSLLRLITLSALLEELATTEAELIQSWSDFYK